MTCISPDLLWLQTRAQTYLATAVSQPLQQQGDVMLQDVEDDLEDLGPMQAPSTQRPQAHNDAVQQEQARLKMRPIKQSEVRNSIKLWPWHSLSIPCLQAPGHYAIFTRVTTASHLHTRKDWKGKEKNPDSRVHIRSFQVL